MRVCVCLSLSETSLSFCFVYLNRITMMYLPPCPVAHATITQHTAMAQAVLLVAL